MIEFRIAKPEDYDHMPGDKLERIDYVYTLEDDVILGMGGFSMIVPTTAWCWVDITPEGEKRLLTSYRVIAEWIDKFVSEMGIVRLQAFVKDIPRNIRLVEHLGFQRESTMKQFYGNEDAFMYRRLF